MTSPAVVIDEMVKLKGRWQKVKRNFWASVGICLTTTAEATDMVSAAFLKTLFVFKRTKKELYILRYRQACLQTARTIMTQWITHRFLLILIIKYLSFCSSSNGIIAPPNWTFENVWFFLICTDCSLAGFHIRTSSFLFMFFILTVYQICKGGIPLGITFAFLITSPLVTGGCCHVHVFQLKVTLITSSVTFCWMIGGMSSVMRLAPYRWLGKADAGKFVLGRGKD